MDRRTAIKKTVNAGLAAGAVASFPSFILPALAQGEGLVPFSDMPADYRRGPARPIFILTTWIFMLSSTTANRK